jgi:hypothetical protein
MRYDIYPVYQCSTICGPWGSIEAENPEQAEARVAAKLPLPFCHGRGKVLRWKAVEPYAFAQPCSRRLD